MGNVLFMEKFKLPSNDRSHEYRKIDSDNDETQNSTKPSTLKRWSKALRKLTLKTKSKGKELELFTPLLKQNPHSDDAPNHAAGSNPDQTSLENLTQEIKIIKSANGDSYQGELKDGEFHGHGEITFSNGDQYNGEFSNGKMNGHGTFTSIVGNTYVGELKDGKLHGHGEITFSMAINMKGNFQMIK